MLLLGSTYSIFTSQEIDETANVYKTGNLNVTYSVSSNTIQFTAPILMTIEEADAVFPYRVTVTNTGNVPYEFDVILMDTTSSKENTIDYQYIMTKVGYLDPVALNNCTNNIIKENVIVPAGEKVDIDIRIWLDSTLPNTEIGKSFYAKLKIDGLAVYNDDEDIDNSKLSLRYMKNSSASDFGNDAYRTYITTASFVDYIDTTNASINTETNEKIMWDMSTNQDKSIFAWLEENGELNESGNKLYNLYIGSKDEIYAKSLNLFFRNMITLGNINFYNLNTSLTTNMTGMFDTCSSLISLDLSKFDTSNVTSMGSPANYSYGGMFMGCTALRTLNLDNWNTSKVTQFGNMFRDCSSLIDLDVGSFDTFSATNMSRMFENCSSLTSLDLSSFDTSNLTSLERMFMYCGSLINLNLSSFDTRNVTCMREVFKGCQSLIELDLSNFDTGNVINFTKFLYRCESLVKVNVSSFNTSNATNMEDMFNGCSSLIELDLSNFDTGNVTNMSGMFKDCTSLINLNLSSFDIRNVTNMKWLFYMCHKLQTSLVINCNSVSNYTEMFLGAITAEGSSIVLYYVGDNPFTTDVNESTYDLVEAMRVQGPNVVNGGCMGNYCSV